MCTNVAESGLTIPNVGQVISSGAHRRGSVDVRTGVMATALQALSKSQMTQQKGRTGRTGSCHTIGSVLQGRIAVTVTLIAILPWEEELTARSRVGLLQQRHPKTKNDLAAVEGARS